jgi:phosphinothricin acetyltransferase
MTITRLIRTAVEADMAHVQAIYAWQVVHGLASFEEIAPDVEEITRRWQAVCARGFPYLAAEMEGTVVGYAYAAPYRTRSAYRFTVENSVYVDRQCHGKGIGRALLAELIRRCEQLDLRQMVAVIGDSDNHASIGLHAALGFRHVGVLSAVGFKHGRWVDSVLMPRALGPGSTSQPA